MIDVVWLKARCLCWDQHQLDKDLTDLGASHYVDVAPGEGCVLVVPARFFTPAEVNEIIGPLRWVLVILTSDEESTFDHAALDHPNMRVWVMTPRPGVHTGDRFLGEGCPADTSEILAQCEAADRPLDVSFAGQVTHRRRVEMAAAMRSLPPDVASDMYATEGFAQGLPRAEYLSDLAATKVAPCPSGPATPDSFRLYEALEAGCLPIADGHTPDPRYPDGYWPLLFGEAPPFPVIDDWADLPKEVDAALAGWPANATRASAWWQQAKLTIRRRIAADLESLSGAINRVVPVTVIIPTSPIPSHPSTTVIEATVASIRAQLPDSLIIIVADGVRPEQEARRGPYEHYLRRLTWLTAHQWTHVVPLILDHHAHQANTTRAALEMVLSPLVLFVEHDTPLAGDIDWEGCSRAIQSGRANVIRFHHETEILEPHRHLMLDAEPQDVEGVPLLRTVQWSQRPHLASTGFYRQMLAAYFGTLSRTMIEDVMHGVVHTSWTQHRDAGWQQFRLWMYAPKGSLQRSLHLDGRADDPKFDMEYAYDGPTPVGAPAPTAGRL